MRGRMAYRLVPFGFGIACLEVVLVNAPGGTLGHQLVRAFILTGDDYDAEVWLDAHTGDLVNVIDRIETFDGTVRGGIYPDTNTAGTEDLRALPFTNVVNNGVAKTADASGVYDYSPSGSLATASLSGPFIAINDFCGASSLSTSLPPGDMTFGGGAGTDCATPGLGGPGNTHAARTAFYHLNLIKEKARKYLDSDPQTITPWLSQALTRPSSRWVAVSKQVRAWRASSMCMWHSPLITQKSARLSNSSFCWRRVICSSTRRG